MSKDAEREKRLAEALRENLKRRKAQARGESVAGASPVGQNGEHVDVDNG